MGLFTKALGARVSADDATVLFPIWDHLFGTHLDPEKVDRNLTFGIGESIHLVIVL
jgi:hypothetical protein